MNDEVFNPNNVKFKLVMRNLKDFHIGQSYDNEPVKTITCSVCGNNRFIVGQCSNCIAIKCIICEYEICIHNG